MSDVNPASIVLVALVVSALIFSPLGDYIAQQTGRSRVEGTCLGALFGPLGCLIAALLPTNPRKIAGAATGRIESEAPVRTLKAATHPGDAAEATRWADSRRAEAVADVWLDIEQPTAQASKA